MCLYMILEVAGKFMSQNMKLLCSYSFCFLYLFSGVMGLSIYSDTTHGRSIFAPDYFVDRKVPVLIFAVVFVIKAS